MRALSPPPFVQEIADATAHHGGRAYLVGGSVRDHLMGLTVKDWDLEVYGLPAKKLERALRSVGRVNTVGKAFSVYKLRRGNLEIDVSLPRRDSKQGPGHKGIVAEGDPHMSLDEAARRRDLTINALMWDLHDHVLIDRVGGLTDLKAGVLRAVDDDTFLEDPLRALRVVQFAGRLNFQPTPELIALCQRAQLDELPEERVQGEWLKLFLKGTRPSLGITVSEETAVTSRVFPEAHAAGVSATGAALDRAVQQRPHLGASARQLVFMLAIWLHPASPSDVEATLDRLRLHRLEGYTVRDHVLSVISHLDDPSETPADLRWLSTHAEVELVLRVRDAIRPDPVHLEQLARASALGVTTAPPPRLLLGRHLKALGVPPGPHMGELLRAVYAQQLDGDVETPEQALAAARAWLSAPPDSAKTSRDSRAT